MNQGLLHAILYGLSTFTALLATICMSIGWLHWQRSLDRCYNESNCGCILFGTWIPTMFKGGDVAICRFVTLCPVPVILWSFVMFGYHTYRSCVQAKHSNTINLKTGERVRQRRDKKRNTSSAWYILLAVIGSFFTILMLSSAVTMTLGYYNTCSEYRKAVVDQTSATGEFALLFLNRVSCSAILDYMDYLQPDPETLPYKYRRTSRINTSVTMQLAMLSTWANFLIFSAITVYDIVLCRQAKYMSKRTVYHQTDF